MVLSEKGQQVLPGVIQITGNYISITIGHSKTEVICKVFKATFLRNKEIPGQDQRQEGKAMAVNDLQKNWKDSPSVYVFNYTDIDGAAQSMEQYRGHVLIIANVASKCGLTCVNYEQLTQLYDKYSENEGLRILAFPCNQFSGQEPLDEPQIKEFVKEYNVRYNLSSKINVNGDDALPLWKFLKHKQGGTLGDFIKWNFTKFLVDKQGNVVKRYGPNTNPKEMEKDLLHYFAQQ